MMQVGYSSNGDSTNGLRHNKTKHKDGLQEEGSIEVAAQRSPVERGQCTAASGSSSAVAAATPCGPSAFSNIARNSRRNRT